MSSLVSAVDGLWLINGTMEDRTRSRVRCGGGPDSGGCASYREDRLAPDELPIVLPRIDGVARSDALVGGG